MDLGQHHGTFVDLFAGCGGLSLGLMQAGWQGLFGVERDSLAFETLQANLVDRKDGPTYAWPTWLTKEPHEISEFIAKHVPELASLKGKVDLIAGGPPCQGFSLAGRRKKNDPRNGLFKHYIEIVKQVQPPFLLLENVRGISLSFTAKSKGSKQDEKIAKEKPFSEVIRESLEEAGYAVFPRHLRAVDFGVPQYRPRYIVLAVRKELLLGLERFDPFAELEQTRVAFLGGKGLPTKRPVTVRQAISDLEIAAAELVECTDCRGFKQGKYSHPKTDYQRLMHGNLNGIAPNSMRLARHHDDTRKRFQLILDTCRHGVQLSSQDRERLGLRKHCTVPLDGNKPSHTLTTLPDDILHYSEPRILTVREYARLQSFPDWFEFKGKYTTGGDRRLKECPRYTQVGNAVPPLLAQCLGEMLMQLAQRLGVPKMRGHAEATRTGMQS